VPLAAAMAALAPNSAASIRAAWSAPSALIRA
jgi:hypothetical protein